MSLEASDKNLSSRLLYLPLSLEGRVQLWLAFKNLKPVSTVMFKHDLKQPFKNKRMLKWLHDANMVLIPDSKSKSFGYVSHDVSLAQRASKIMWSEKRDDNIEKGKLFGYPPVATIAFADEKPVRALIPSNFPHYWASYTRYVVREEYAMEDSLKGKEWGDVIRKEVPKLASWVEKFMQSAELR